MITRQTISKIILAKVLEMQLGKYLAFIENIIQQRTQLSHTKDLLTKKSDRSLAKPCLREASVESIGQARLSPSGVGGQVFGKVMIEHDTLFAKRSILTFRVSDKRLLNIYAMPLWRDYSHDKIVCSIKWINTRNRFSMHIVKSLLRYQRDYWFSGKEDDLQPLTLKQFLALYPLLYLDKSRLSRLLHRLFVLPQQGEVICLKKLFLSAKRVYAYRIKELIHSSQLTLKDKDIQTLLAPEGIHLSLRTICNCRKLLNIPNYKERAAHYYGRDIAFSDYRELSDKKFNRIPAEPGVYQLSIPAKLEYERHKSDIIYIGSSRDLRKRIAHYSGNGVKNDQLSQFLKKHRIFVRFYRTEHYRALEQALLKNFKDNYGELPKCNSVG